MHKDFIKDSMTTMIIKQQGFWTLLNWGYSQTLQIEISKKTAKHGDGLLVDFPHYNLLDDLRVDLRGDLRKFDGDSMERNEDLANTCKQVEGEWKMWNGGFQNWG